MMMAFEGNGTFKHRFAILLRALLAAFLLYLLFQFIDLQSVVQAFLVANPWYLCGGAVLVFANLGLQLLKWRYFVRLLNPENSNTEIAGSLLFGILLGTITPGQLGEFGGRAFRHRSIPAASVIGLTLVDKLQMMCILAVGGGVSLVHLLRVPSPWNLLLMACILTTGVGLFFKANSLFGLLTRFDSRIRDHRFVRQFFSVLGVFSTKDLWISFILSVAFYGVLYLQMMFFLNAFTPVSATTAFLGFASMMFLKSLLPISLGDLGIREATSAYFYSLCGVSESSAVGAALLLFAVNVLFPSLLGLFFIPKLSSE